MPVLLDLFCGAGGAAVGYQRAGFEVIGVDVRAQPRYPFRFIRMEALHYLAEYGDEGVDAIHASPPCQAWSVGAQNARLRAFDGPGPRARPMLIGPVRTLLWALGRPYVIENVPQAPLEDPVLLCGSSLGLEVKRHRAFECSFPVMAPPCAHGRDFRFQRYRAGKGYERARFVSVAGGSGGKGGLEGWSRAMGIDWMRTRELREAVPPAYTELIGGFLAEHLRQAAAA